MRYVTWYTGILVPVVVNMHQAHVHGKMGSRRVVPPIAYHGNNSSELLYLCTHYCIVRFGELPRSAHAAVRVAERSARTTLEAHRILSAPSLSICVLDEDISAHYADVHWHS